MWCICRAGPSLGPLILGHSFAFGAPGMQIGLGLNLFELHVLISLIFPMLYALSSSLSLSFCSASILIFFPFGPHVLVFFQFFILMFCSSSLCLAISFIFSKYTSFLFNQSPLYFARTPFLQPVPPYLYLVAF